MPKKRTAALFDRICLESVNPLCFIRVRVGHVWLRASYIMPKKHTVVYFARACQEGEYLLIFDRVHMLKPPENAQYYKYNVYCNFCQALRAQFTCQASEEQEVECDEPLK